VSAGSPDASLSWFPRDDGEADRPDEGGDEWAKRIDRGEGT